jgi:hypothetical protein
MDIHPNYGISSPIDLLGAARRPGWQDCGVVAVLMATEDFGEDSISDSDRRAADSYVCRSSTGLTTPGGDSSVSVTRAPHSDRVRGSSSLRMVQFFAGRLHR